MKKTLLILIAFSVLFVFHAPSYAVQIESLGVDIHGFISQGFLQSSDYNYLANDSKKGSFQFNEMGVNFSKQVMDNLRIGAQFFARDLGDAANNKVTIDWAYGDYRFEDWLGVRAGRIKSPFGLYSETRDVDMLRACIILPQGMYNDLNRDVQIAINGGALYGNIPLSGAGSLEYNMMMGVGNIDPDSGTGEFISGTFGGAKLSSYNTDTSYILTMRWNTPLSGLALKGSFWSSPNNMPLTFNNTVNINMSLKAKMQAYSAEYIWKDLTLSAEYWTVMSDIDLTTAGSLIQHARQRSESYYIMGSYRFLQWLEAGAYYVETFPDASHSGREGDRYTVLGQPDFWAWQKDTAVFTRFDINSYLVFKVEGHYVDGAAYVLPTDNSSRDEQNWWYFAAKATFSF